ncbi:hypothetical protein [Falsibacillus pallidus]|uniref:hypothetical protein n=1 Tax=Falsibacillus pallidus TaxID=493781 RepID=UPI003D96C26C
MEFGIHISAYMILAALGIMILGRIVQWFLRMTANLDNLDEKLINKGRQISIFIIGICLLVLATLPAPDMGGVYIRYSEGMKISGPIHEITLIRQSAIIAGWLSAICFSMMPLLVYILERFTDKKH